MNKTILFFLIVAGAVGFLIYRQVTADGWPNIIKIGSKAPDFILKDKDGNEMRLSGQRGKLVVLNFFRSDCGPCIQEMPDLQVLNKLFAGRPFQMITISGDSDWKPVEALYEQKHISLPTLLDPGTKVFRKYNLTGTPETFVINARGYIVKHYIGAANWLNPEVLRSIDTWIRTSS